MGGTAQRFVPTSYLAERAKGYPLLLITETAPPDVNAFEFNHHEEVGKLLVAPDIADLVCLVSRDH